MARRRPYGEMRSAIFRPRVHGDKLLATRDYTQTTREQMRGASPGISMQSNNMTSKLVNVCNPYLDGRNNNLDYKASPWDGGHSVCLAKILILPLSYFSSLILTCSSLFMQSCRLLNLCESVPLIVSPSSNHPNK